MPTCRQRPSDAGRAAVALLALMLLLPGCVPPGASDTLVVVGTTTHIQSIVSAIGGRDVEAPALAPGGMCPGHFDIAPGHVRLLQRADALLMHGWEQWAPAVIEAAGNDDLTVMRLQTKGNAMVPRVHAALSSEILGILCALDSSRSGAFRGRAAAYLATVNDSMSAVTRRAARLEGVVVACSEHQRAFLEWLGCSIAVSYGRPEELTPSALGEVERKSRAAGVALIVDNIQSGADAAAALSADLGASHTALSNFPMAGSYVQTLSANVTRLLEGVADHE